MKKLVYMDCAATMPAYRDVVREMENFFLDEFGNPSSAHKQGEIAMNAMNEARKKIAGEIGAKVWEIVFTSGATESNNLAIFGVMRANKEKGKNKIIISAIEHSSIWEACEELKKEGFEVVEVGVNNEGFVDLMELENKIDEDTILVSIMHANNEIGTIQDLKKIGELCEKKGAIFHTDAVQSFGKERVSVSEIGIDMLSASGHKIGGPKGIGFLYIREGLEVKPMLFGGGQERGLRAGTENVPGIMGMAKALEIMKNIDKKKIETMGDYFVKEIEKLGGKINGPRDKRIGGNVHATFSGVDAEAAVIALSQKGIMCSTGSACENLGKSEKKVLRAIGLTDEEIKGSIRFSFSEEIEKRDIDYVIEEMKKLKLFKTKKTQ